MFRAFVTAAAIAAVLGASFAIAKSSGGSNAGGAPAGYGGKAGNASSSRNNIGVKPAIKLSKNVDETAFCELMREKYGPSYSRRGCDFGNN